MTEFDDVSLTEDEEKLMRESPIFGELYKSIKASEQACDEFKKSMDELDDVLLHKEAEKQTIKGDNWIIITPGEEKKMKRTPIDLKRMIHDRQAMQCRYPAVADASDEVKAWLIEWAQSHWQELEKEEDIQDYDNSKEINLLLGKLDCIQQILGMEPKTFFSLIKTKHGVNQE